MNKIKILIKNHKASIFLASLLMVNSVINGCDGKDDLAIRYKTEEMLSKADRLKERLLIGGIDISNDDFKRLKDAYKTAANSVDLPDDRTEIEIASDDIKQAWAIALLAYTRIASLYLDRREYDSAFVYYQKVSVSPAVDDLQRNVIYRHMAYAKERAGRYEEASALYDSVSTGYLKLLKPASPEMEAITAPVSKAEMFMRLGDNRRFKRELKNARSYYRGIIDEYPGSSAAEISLGKIAASYMLQGSYNEALDILKSSGRDDEGKMKPGTLLLVSDIYMNKIKDYENAEKYYREFLELYPDHIDKPKAMLGLGLSLYEMGRYKDARDAVSGIEKSRGVSEQILAQAHNLVALCYEAEGNWQLAQGQLEYIKATFPGNRTAYEAALYIVAHYRSRGIENSVEREFNEAVKYINRYVEFSSQNPVAEAQAIGYLARAYIENGDIETAIEKLERLYHSFSETPDGLMAPLKIADLYENALGDTSSAAKWLNIYIDQNRSAANIAKLKEHLKALEGG